MKRQRAQEQGLWRFCFCRTSPSNVVERFSLSERTSVWDNLDREGAPERGCKTLKLSVDLSIQELLLVLAILKAAFRFIR